VIQKCLVQVNTANIQVDVVMPVVSISIEVTSINSEYVVICTVFEIAVCGILCILTWEMCSVHL